MFHPKFAHLYPLHSDIWDLDQEETSVRVANIVATATLSEISSARRQEQSAHIRFPHQLHVCFEVDGDATNAYIYQKGVMNLVGIRSYEKVAVCVARAYDYICKKDPSRRPVIVKMGTENIVAAGKLRQNINLEALRQSKRFDVIYQTKKFPGARLEIGGNSPDSPPAVYKVFRSGCFYTVGSTSHKEIIANAQRFPAYVASVLYNKVCVLCPPELPPLASLLPAVNGSELARVCGGKFVLATHPSLPKEGDVLISQGFFREDDAAPGNQALRTIYQMIITRTGKLLETTCAPAAGANSVRRRARDAHAQFVGVMESTGPLVPYGSIQDCAAFHPQTVHLIAWAQALNSCAELVKHTGAFSLCISHLYATLQTTQAIVLHPSGDLSIPEALQSKFAAEGIDEDRLVDRIWETCKFTPFPSYASPGQSDLPLCLKKIAAELKRKGHACTFEPLANVIRFENGGVMRSDGTLEMLSTVLLREIWAIARVSFESARKRKRPTQPPVKPQSKTPALKKACTRKGAFVTT